MDELLQDFLTETSESLASIDNDLVAFEQTPDDPTLVRNIFRMVHTIKGTCGFIGLTRLGHVGHAAENVLGLFRDGKITANAEIIGTVLASIDCMKEIVAGIEATGKEPVGDDSALIARLDAVTEGDAASKQAVPVADIAIAEPEPDEFGFVPVPASQTRFIPKEPVAKAEVPEPVAPKEELVKALVAAEVAVSGDAPIAAAQTVRVSIPLLESLMTSVSELVLTRNQLVQGIRDLEIGVVKVPLQRLSQIVSELQEGVMKTRMQPIGNAWQKLPRLIRDLSNDLNKKIELQMSGAETEVDRQVLEIIKDPLTHMIRNSADHGLETPAERVQAGKPETGHVIVRAYHQSGHIVIEVGDDGRGLNSTRIRQKLIERGIVTEAMAALLSPAQIHRYIFDAGFSTATQVTAVSGRGVGMDVVKSNIEKIGGTIDLQSVEGAGTTFIIRIPLTLAIASALIIETAGERFAIPQSSVLELVMVSPNSHYRIETINGAPLLRLRDRLLPVLHLGRTLALSEEALPEQVYILVVQAGSHIFGVAVDRVLDTEEIVIKPVARILKDLAIYGGNTILGDGRVVMILDVNGLAETVAKTEAKAPRAETVLVAPVEQTAASSRVLIFAAGSQGPVCAVPLAEVARIENLSLETLEQAGGRTVLQYRGSLMPLEVIGDDPLVREETRPILVFDTGHGPFGLVVSHIVDVIQTEIELRFGQQNPCFLGTAIIAGKATEVLDIGHLASTAWRGDNADASASLLHAA